MRQALAWFLDRMAERKRFEARLMARVGTFYAEIAGLIDQDGTTWADVKRAWPWRKEKSK